MAIIDNYGTAKPIKITIIGNGFDLALKAKTSYEDFYQCLKQCFQAKSIEKFNQLYFHAGNEKFIEPFYKLVNDNRDNYFINYFLKYEVVFGNWVSFEKELTKIIKSFDVLVSCLNTSDKLFLDHQRVSSSIPVSVRITDQIDLMRVLSVYPENKFFKTTMNYWFFDDDGRAVPFEIKGKQFKNQYEVYKAIEDFSEEFPKDLFKELMVFSDLFSLYLGIANHHVKLNAIIKDAKDSHYFINYNFTNYLEKMMEKAGLYSRSVLYINGLAKNIDGNHKENIVFGIDSNTRLSNLSFEVFTKRIQRSIRDTPIFRLGHLMDNPFKEIVVIGHSLNIADYESLHFLFSKCSGKLKPTIRIYYFDEEAKINLIINLKTILSGSVFDEYQRDGLIKFTASTEAWEQLREESPSDS